MEYPLLIRVDKVMVRKMNIQILFISVVSYDYTSILSSIKWRIPVTLIPRIKTTTAD